MTVIKYKIKPAKDTIAAASKMEKQMGNEWAKSFYEIVTNFPEDVMKIDYVLTNNLDGSVDVIIKQDGNDYTQMQTVIDNITEDNDDINISQVKERDNGSSMFGIGTSNISYYNKDYKFSVRVDDKNFETLNRETGEVTEEVINDIESWVKVVQRFTIPSGPTPMEDKLKVFQIIIGMVDAPMINKGCKHTFYMNSFSSDIEKLYSGEVEALNLLWKLKNKSGNPVPDYTSLRNKDKTPRQEVNVLSLSNSKVDKQIKLTFSALGLIDGKNDIFWNLGTIKDTPYLFIYLNEGRGQLVGRVPLRGLSGKQHLNNVMSIASCSKSDIRNFYSSPDKFKGFIPEFNTAVLKTIQPIVENTYEDSDTKEKSKQLYVEDVIIYSSYGGEIYEDEADEHRKSLGIGFFNDLSVEERENLVTPESWVNKKHRLDIKVRYPKELSGLDEDTVIVIEMKNDNFNVSDIKQGILYTYTTKGATHLYGVSVDISDKNFKSYKELKREVNESNQRRLSDLKGALIDLNKKGWRWKNVEDYYRLKVEDKLESLKEDSSDES